MITFKIHMLLVCGLLLCGLPAHARDHRHDHRVAQSPPSFMDSFLRLNATTTPQERKNKDTVPTTSPEAPTTTEEVTDEEATSTPSKLPAEEEPAPPEEEPALQEEENTASSTPPEEAAEEDRSDTPVPPVLAGTGAPPANPYDTGSPLSVVQTVLLLALAGTSGVAGTLLLKRTNEPHHRPLQAARSGRIRTTAPERY